MYIAYRCKTCNRTFLLLVEEVKHSEEESRYITCPFDGRHKDIIVVGRYDDLKDCMQKYHIYKKVNGKIKQIK